MIELLIWCFIAYGMTTIIVWGSIFNPIRSFFRRLSEMENKNNPLKYVGTFFHSLMTCMLCSGTWVGFFLGLFVYSPIYFYFYSYWLQHSYWFFDGMFSAGTVWAINSIIEWYENNKK